MGDAAGGGRGDGVKVEVVEGIGLGACWEGRVCFYDSVGRGFGVNGGHYGEDVVGLGD